MTKRNITYIEIPTQNGTESANFYEALFDWKMTTLPDMGDYTLWEAGEGPNGGFTPVGEQTRAGEVMISVNSEDIASDLQKAAALGGSLVCEKTEIPGIGWYGIFKDPTGNSITLYTQLGKSAESPYFQSSQEESIQ